jgi:hypothetical protein
VLYLLGWIAFLICLLVVRPAWQARRPSDMPRNSVWIDAPALPFSFCHGWWFGCWIDSDGKSNCCKLSSVGTTAYERLYVSYDSKAPVQGNELQLSAPSDSMGMWVGTSESSIFAPAAFLTNGKVLVPVEDLSDCEKFRPKLRTGKTKDGRCFGQVLISPVIGMWLFEALKMLLH